MAPFATTANSTSATWSKSSSQNEAVEAPRRPLTPRDRFSSLLSRRHGGH